MSKTLRRMVAPLERKISLMMARVIVRMVSDAGGLQTMQVSATKDELRDKVQRFQQYGMTSSPLPGASGIIVFLNGNRDHPVIIAVDDPRYRKKCEPGEVVIYTDEGDEIRLKRGRKIEITTSELTVKAETKVRFETPIVEVTGDVIDRADAGGQSMSDMRAVHNDHDHPYDDGTTGKANQRMGA